MKLSLRAKITLALLFTGLTSAAFVGVIARALFMQQFNRVAYEASFQSFQGDIRAYVEAHGSLDTALQSEPFPDFVERRRQTVPAPTRNVGAGSVQQAPPGRRGGGPGRGFVPPFFFTALDLQGRPILGRGGLAPGAPVTPELRAQARPIVVRGQTVAYAVPIEQRNVSAVDATYLDAMQNAMTYGVIGAGLLALGLGFFFSGRLSANLRVLTQAMHAMRAGDLRQHVKVRSRDEVGFLADSFNQMSEELATSHDTVRQQAERLKELSIRDEITQLHNRRYFDEQAALAYFQASRYGRPLTVAIADIDHFKQINDRFSHAAGDAVLRQVGRILSEGTRESDIVARYGGEEFVIAFPETSLHEAAATCERIRRVIEAHPWTGIHPDLAVTITVGVDAMVSRGTVERMMESADERLYEGKHAGRNRVCGVEDQAAV